jgi:membrane peptidoglycan carboxypeptidase
MDPQPRPVLRRPVQPRMSTAGSVAMVLFALLAGIGVIVAVGVVGAYGALAAGLPDADELDNLVTPEESIVYDRTGQTELARFGDFQREIVAFEDIPGFVVDATTAVEDKSFWTNPGFDPAAIFAAGLDAIRGNPRGASTITQQLVRQRLLDPDLVQARGRQIERKLKEIIQSIRVTRHYQAEGLEGKQQIIQIYMNSNFYGNNSYGIKAAARSYFGVENLEDLSLAQAAILAAIPQSPSRHDLVRNAVPNDDGELEVPPDTEIVQRRNLVLQLMSEDRTPLSLDQFGPEDFAEAQEEPVILVEQESQPWTARTSSGRSARS